MSERHGYVSAGISREAFTEQYMKATSTDSDLTCYVHEHKWIPFDGLKACNDKCTQIQQGETSPVLPSDKAALEPVE